MTTAGASINLLPLLARSKFLRANVATPFFEANRRLWPDLPQAMTDNPPLRGYGRFLHHLARMRQERKQSDWTCFLRNRAEIAYIAALGKAAQAGEVYSVAVLGCSTGAEAYSAVYALRDSLSRIDLKVHASDISASNIERAMTGVYQKGGVELETLSAAEIDAFFVETSGLYSVRPRWRASISWAVADALAENLADTIDRHDLVLASKFLCHMEPDVAARCFRNIVTTVKDGGVLLVSGVDLEVRAAVARELNLIPDAAAIAALHDGDVTVRRSWPFDYWGLEPLDRSRRDWPFRYGVAFRKP